MLQRSVRVDSNIKNSKMLTDLLMKEKQRIRKMRCGWGRLGREKAQLRDKWSSVYAFQIYAKSVKEATIFDLDPTAERGTRKCRACKMNLICLFSSLEVYIRLYTAYLRLIGHVTSIKYQTAPPRYGQSY